MVMDYIKRDAENTIQKLFEVFPIVTLVGMRQSGKTTLAKAYCQNRNIDFVYVDLERSVDIRRIENTELFFEAHIDKFIIIDEAQQNPTLFSALRPIVDRYRDRLKLLLLGSAGPGLRQGVNESLAGRSALLKLWPLNAQEIKGLGDWKKHLINGGFPLSFLQKKPDLGKIWLDEFIKNFIYRDLQAFGFPSNTKNMARLIEMLAWQTANQINYNDLAKSLGLSHNTVRNYIDYIEKAFFVYRIEPYFFNVKKRMVKSPKLFFSDVACVCRLLHIDNFSSLIGSPLVGRIWENYVFNQVMAVKSEKWTVYYYRTSGGAEIDMVLCKGIRPKISVEIKFSEAPKISRGFTESINSLETRENYIVKPGVGEPYKIREDVKICDLNHLLDIVR